MRFLLYILMVILFLMQLTSCKTIVPVEHTYTVRDSVHTREKLVPITVPGSSVTTHIGKGQYDSLLTALQSLPRNNRTIYLTDPKLQTRLQIFLDSTGKALAFKCETLEREHQATITERDHYRSEYEKLVVDKKEKWHVPIVRFFKNGFTWLVLVLISGVAFIILRKAKRVVE